MRDTSVGPTDTLSSTIAISTQTDNLAICETFVDSKVDLATYEDIVLSFLRKHLQKKEMS